MRKVREKGKPDQERYAIKDSFHETSLIHPMRGTLRSRMAQVNRASLNQASNLVSSFTHSALQTREASIEASGPEVQSSRFKFKVKASVRAPGTLNFEPNLAF